MMKTEFHSDTCDYCHSPAVFFTETPSSEPVSLCDAMGCEEEFNMQCILQREHLRAEAQPA